MKDSRKILFIDDDIKLRKIFALDFRDFGFEVYEASSVAELELLSPTLKIDFTVLDLRLTGENGISAIEPILLKWSDCQIIILTGYGSISSAVEAIKKGAKEYFTKPITSEFLLEALSGEHKSIAIEEANSPHTLERMEHEYIDFVMSKYQGNISKAAKALGLHRQSLQRKLKKMPNIKRPLD